MVDSNCNDLHYRYDAVVLALRAGLQNKAEPERLPANIYGTEGDWENFSTPSRDARLKTAFKELREQTERFVKMYEAGDSKLVYKGHDLVGDLIAVYDRELRPAISPISAPTPRPWRSATTTCASGCSSCRSIPINASSAAGAPPIHTNSPPAATDSTSRPGTRRNRTCATSSTAPMTPRWTSPRDELRDPRPRQGRRQSSGHRRADVSGEHAGHTAEDEDAVGPIRSV